MRVRSSTIWVVAFLALLGFVGFLAFTNTRRLTVPIYGGQVSEDGTVLTLGTGACSRDQTASVQETSTEVRIRVKAKQTDLKCASGVIVHLAAPLGRRTVIDRKTGRVVAIG